VRAELISIGTELTAGLTVDTNAAWLARALAELGIGAVRHGTVADDMDAIAGEIARAAASADLVLVTGGLGPTEDDLTRQGLAKTMDVALRTDPVLLERLRAFFQSRGYRWCEANARQAQVPDGASAIENRWGTAPGLRARVGRAVVYCLPGVPREMREMFTHAVAADLRANRPSSMILTRTLWCFGAGESWIGQRIQDLMAPGQPVTVGTTAQEGTIGLRLSTQGDDRAVIEPRLDACEAELRQRLGDLVFGRDDETLASVVGGLLRERRQTLATAESCTGGMLAGWITDVPGSSDYFLRGVVTYSNPAKIDLLGVPTEAIERHGAVSAEVAEAMAVGCRRGAGTDFALSVTGIAGPSGGTPDKPVGLVFVGLAAQGTCEVRRFTFGHHLSRDAIRQRSCSAALDLLRRHLIK